MCVNRIRRPAFALLDILANESFCHVLPMVGETASESLRNRFYHPIWFSSKIKWVGLFPANRTCVVLGDSGEMELLVEQSMLVVRAAEFLSYLFLHCDEHDELSTDPNGGLGPVVPSGPPSHSGCSGFNGRFLYRVPSVGKVARFHQGRRPIG